MTSTTKKDEDPRFPGGMNYLDWLFNVLAPDERTPTNIDQIIAFMRKARDSKESGVKPKKADYEPKIDVAKLMRIKAKPGIKVRPL